MKKRVADIIIETLLEEGVDQCFAVVGGGAMHIDNALAVNDGMKKVFCHHEQACAISAEGYARASGKPALVSVTSGPGALNTLNGVEGAYVDSIPMIVIAGHPRWDTTINVTGLDLRCRGVQECDIVPYLKGMTKYSAYLTEPIEVVKEIKKAVRISMEGRRGPVWLSVPLDIQNSIVNTDELDRDNLYEALGYSISKEDFELLNDDIRMSKRPVILPGTGVKTGGETDRFRKWTKIMNIPVVAGSLIPDLFYEGAPNYYGTSGILGERKGNFILQNADLIIAIGNSLAYKQTGFNQDLFAPYAKIIMIDACADESKKPGVRADFFLHADVKTFFDSIDNLAPWNPNEEWINYCNSLEEKLGNVDEDTIPEASSRIPSHYMWNMIRKNILDDMYIVLGNNSGMQNCIQRSVLKPDQHVVINYNSGSMGYDLPAAVGVACAMKRDVLCVTGDGSIMMNLQELQTIKHYDLPVKVIIMSNDGYGTIRQTNKNFFDGCYIGCDEKSGVSFPDFAIVAEAFKLPFKKCKKSGDVEDAIKWLTQQEGAAVVEIDQQLDDPTTPKLMSKLLPDGSFATPALQDLSPFISDELMKELMPEW